MLKYEHNLDLETENSPSLILRQISKGAKVLELGPATGYMTRYMKEKLGCTIYCIELDPDAAKITEQYCDRMIVANLEDLRWSDFLEGEMFDYIIFADVLEHLRNPVEVLKTAAKFADKNGTVITSIPNIAHNSIIMGLMRGEFEYKELGLLDNTHVKFFTKRSIMQMLDKAGLSPVTILATVAGPEETEFNYSYKDYSEDLQKLLLENHEGHVYQYIISSKPKLFATDNKYIESIDRIEDRYNFLQVYWNKDGLFSETNSVTCPIYYDGLIHTYELQIPSDIEGGILRIDPGNWSGFIKLKSLMLFGCKHEDFDEIKLKESSVTNGFDNLSQGDNVILIGREDSVELFSLNQDPQLFWTIGPVINSKSIKLTIQLSATKDIDRLKQYVGNLSEQFSIQSEKLSSLTNQVNIQNYQLHVKSGEIDEQVKLLEELKQKNNKYLEENKELNRINQDFVSENLLLKQELVTVHGLLSLANETIKKLNNDRSINDLTIQQVLSSRSWRITAPLRRFGHLAKQLKRNVLNVLYVLSDYKFNISLTPIHDLEKLEHVDYWRAIGKDPAFWIQGRFPKGWVVLQFSSSSNNAIPLKMYWDRGAGLSEIESSVIGKIPSGDTQNHRIVMAIPSDAKLLRLDPGDNETEFQLSNMTFRKISRMHLLYYAFKNQWIHRGYSIPSLFKALKRLEQIRRVSGIPGVWNKVKNVLGLTQEGFNIQDYQEWIEDRKITEKKKEEILKEITTFKYKPLISILVPVYNVDEMWLRKCIDSVRNQLYSNWELCIADDASTKSHVRKVLESYAALDSRIKVVFRNKNGHISESSNSALEIATGEYVGLLDHDDELTIDALYENVKLINEHPEADMIYSDEDKISPEGTRYSPFFKPDWSPEMLLSQMYTCHLGIYRTSLVKEIGGFRKGFEGSQDYDLVLRLTEKTNQIYHIPKILYHWRSIPESTASGGVAKTYTNDAGYRALVEAVQRRGLGGRIEPDLEIPNLYTVHPQIVGNPRISIIIPTRNMGDILDVCLKSIFEKSTYKNYEVIVVDNGSDDTKTLQLLENWGYKEPERFFVERIDIPFNYSRLNNLAVKRMKGDLVLLLNNDIEVITPTWLEEMAAQAMRSEIGAVGARLLYPDNTLQHAGIILGIGGVAGHSHKYFKDSDYGYFSRLRMVSNYSAVTAACLMIRKSVYEKVEGLDENLKVAFNDVDFCLRVRESGYRNLWLPHVKLYHYESKSRGHENTPEKIARFNSEIEYMQKRWGKFLHEDPYYNKNLTLEHENFSIALYKDHS